MKKDKEIKKIKQELLEKYQIEVIKQELLEKYNIKTDRDLIQQLGIRESDKSKLFLWIEYQCAYSYREGYDNGQDELKEQLSDLLTKK